MSNRCDVGHCQNYMDKWLQAPDEPEHVYRACGEHASMLVDLGIANAISAEKAQAIKDKIPGVAGRLCDLESCPNDGEIWLMWQLDEDDDDGDVGCFCEKHAQPILERGHGVRLDEAEAMYWLREDEDAWDELWDALEGWADCYLEGSGEDGSI